MSTSGGVEESTSVAVVGSHRIITGGTPCDQPYLAAELARQLLDELPDDVTEPAIRVTFRVQTLFQFSWELDAAVMRRLATIGASLELCLNHEVPVIAELEPGDADLSVDIRTGELDPDIVTERIGVAGTEVHRRGELSNPQGTRTKPLNIWRYECTSPPDNDLSALARSLCGELPGDLGRAVTDCKRMIAMRMVVNTLTGGFRFDADAVAKLARLDMPFACFLFNVGA